MFTHGFTYSGHPVSCSVGLKNIEIMERMDLCKYFENELTQRLSDLAIVGDVRGSHFMICVENVANKETKELFHEDVAIGNRVDIVVNTLQKAIEDVQDELVRDGIWKG